MADLHRDSSLQEPGRPAGMGPTAAALPTAHFHPQPALQVPDNWQIPAVGFFIFIVMMSFHEELQFSTITIPRFSDPT